ncbi:hypothetical protein L208DRAFT_1497155, partial [Tricholoma matsutake]
MNNETNEEQKLRVLQINLNKSLTAHLELINDSLAAHWDIILIQEPYIIFFSSIRTPNCFTAVTPSSRQTLARHTSAIHNLGKFGAILKRLENTRHSRYQQHSSNQTNRHIWQAPSIQYIQCMQELTHTGSTKEIH